VIAGDGLLAAQDHARLHRLIADATRQHLIQADAAMQFRRPRQRRARQQIAGHAGMDADAGRGLVEQAFDVVELPFQRLERRQAWTQLHRVARSLRPPLRRVDAVSHEQKREPPWRGRRAIGCGAPHRHRFQPRQRHRHAGTA
jgi:hypothetical protein